MKLRRSNKADEAAAAAQAAEQAKQAKKPTHRAIATHEHAGQIFELEIGAAWSFASKRATGLTVVLREQPPNGCFNLIEIAPAPAPNTYNRVTSGSPKGIMPHLRAALSQTVGTTTRYQIIGDGWRTIASDGHTATIHVRLRPGTNVLRFALFNAPVWTP